MIVRKHRHQHHQDHHLQVQQQPPQWAGEDQGRGRRASQQPPSTPLRTPLPVSGEDDSWGDSQETSPPAPPVERPTKKRKRSEDSDDSKNLRPRTKRREVDDKGEDAPKGRGDQHHYLSKPSVVYKTQGDVSAEVGVTTLSEVSNLRSDNSQYSECTDTRRSATVGSVTSLVESNSIQPSEGSAEDVDLNISELVADISRFKLSD